MPWVKCVFQFDLPKAGWSETWYLDKSNLDSAKSPCDNLATIRAKLLGTFGTLEAVRISFVDPPRRSLIRPLNRQGTADTGFRADVPWTAVMGTVKDDTGEHQRVTMLRGIPDSYIARLADGKYDLEGAGTLAGEWSGFMQSLRTNGFHFRARDSSGAWGVETQVTAFGTSAVGNKIKISTTAALTIGSYVTFRDVTGDGGVMKGKHRILRLEGVDYVLATDVPTAANPSSWVGGKVRPVRTWFFPVGGGALQRPAHRDTGRPFGLQRGRQPKKAK